MVAASPSDANAGQPPQESRIDIKFPPIETRPLPSMDGSDGYSRLLDHPARIVDPLDTPHKG
jgi:hypothetical protein